MVRSILVLIAFIVAFTGCSAYRTARHGQADSSSSSLSENSTQIDKASVPQATSSLVTIQGSCVSDLQVVIQVQDVASPIRVACDDGRFSANVTLTGTEGAKQIIVSQSDSKGKSSTDTITVTLDKTAPAVSVLNPAADAFVGGTVVASGNCESGLPVVVSGNGLSAAGSIPCASGIFQATLTLSAGDGAKTLVFTQTDAAANAVTVTRQLTKDTVAPALQINAPAAGAVLSSSSVVVSGSCESGLPVSIQGSGVSGAVQAACVSSSFSGSVILAVGSGSRQIDAVQTDAAGNRGQASRTVSTNITATGLAISAPAAGSFTRGTLTLQGSCVAGTAVDISGDVTAAAATCASGTFSQSITLSNGDGLKNVQVRQTLAAGVAMDSRSFTKDTVAPAIAISAPAANSPAKTGVTLSGSCESGIAVQISGTGVQAQSSAACANNVFSASVTFSAGDGAKAVTVTQTDAAGNAGSASRTFVRDNTGPAITVNSPAEGANASSTKLTLNGACESGLTVSVSGAGLASSVSAMCNNSIYSASVILNQGLGSLPITVSQTDAAGNAGIVIRSVQNLTGNPGLAGANLYAQHCTACHGALDSSSKLGRSAAQINGAIASVSSMSQFASLLSATDVMNIAAALAGAPPTDPQANCTDPGFETIHRLNENEYKNTLRDLFGTQIQYSMAMPVEYGLGGFYNNAKVLEITEDRAQRYLDISEAVINQAMQTNPAAIMTCSPTIGETQCATQILKSIADRAFRRPLAANDPDLSKFVGMVAVAKGQGDTFEAGIRLGIQAILNSPRFLFRMYAPTPVGTPRSLDGYELASRLSYFLWSSMPDTELMNAAPQLSNATTLNAQMVRMLASSKADGFVDNFMSQWLALNMLDAADPDPAFYPGFTSAILGDMKQEVRAMLKYAITQDLSLKDLLSARYSFLNDRLAAHYGIGGVTGSNLRLVNFTSSERMGLLSNGGILTMTSNPNRTSIVRRGHWVMSNLLCNEPPPPPANVPALPADPTNATTLRERMQAHTNNPACIGCHAEMDQFGFSLENFNGVAKFRTTENGIAIDNVAMLPSGENFTGLAGLQDNLTKSVKLDQCFSKRLLSYAIGRKMETADKCAVDKVAGPTQRLSEQKMSEVLKRVITSETFLKIRGEGP